LIDDVIALFSELTVLHIDRTNQYGTEEFLFHCAVNGLLSLPEPTGEAIGRALDGSVEYAGGVRIAMLDNSVLCASSTKPAVSTFARTVPASIARS